MKVVERVIIIWIKLIYIISIDKIIGYFFFFLNILLFVVGLKYMVMENVMFISWIMYIKIINIKIGVFNVFVLLWLMIVCGVFVRVL